MILNKNSIIIEIEKIDIKQITKFIKIIIIFDYFVKNNFFKTKKKKNFKSLKDKKDVKNNLNFRIIDKKNKKIKRFNVSVN